MSREGSPRLRFAPSPTGSIHLGNARTALFNWLVARRGGGTLVLRIEDTDLDRHQAGAEEGILEDLRWLGLDWDEGPDRGGAWGPYRQSERAERYAAAADRLLAGGRAYRCFCSDEQLTRDREAQTASGGTVRYEGRCRKLSHAESERRSRDEPFALRFVTQIDPEAATAERVGFKDRIRGPVDFGVRELGDPVILRQDGRPTYNFAVVVDDAAMGIDLVVRGEDHLSNTPRQVLLYHALEQPLPEFAHLPMVRGTDGSRLSKRHGAVSVADYRRRGYPPAGLLNALVLLGWSPESDEPVLSVEEMVQQFDLDRVGKSPAAFDPDKLDWLSQQQIQRMSSEALAAEVGARLVEAELLPAAALEEAASWVAELGEMVKTGIAHFDQVAERARFVFAPGGEPRTEEARAALRGEGAADVVRVLGELAAADPPVDVEAWKRLKAELVTRTGIKGKRLFQPVRIALSGEHTGPELDQLAPLVTQGHARFPDRVASIPERAARTLASLDG